MSLYSIELIEELRAGGHPIASGTIGENLTLAGLPWKELRSGMRIEAGEVVIELTRHAAPCQIIAGSFRDGSGGAGVGKGPSRLEPVLCARPEGGHVAGW